MGSTSPVVPVGTVFLLYRLLEVIDHIQNPICPNQPVQFLTAQRHLENVDGGRLNGRSALKVGDGLVEALIGSIQHVEQCRGFHLKRSCSRIRALRRCPRYPVFRNSTKWKSIKTYCCCRILRRLEYRSKAGLWRRNSGGTTSNAHGGHLNAYL